MKKQIHYLVVHNQKSQELDLFYEIEPAEVLFVLNKVSDLETFQLLDDEGQPDLSFKFLYCKKNIYRTKQTNSFLKEVLN